jgi:hypothetical protein
MQKVADLYEKKIEEKDEEIQSLIASDVKRKLTGSSGAKVVVAFNSDETKKTTIDSVPLNDAPAHYQYLSEEARGKILLGHSITSGLLFGIPSSNGFSSNADAIGPVAGRSPKMFFLGRKFVKTYSNGKSKAEKIWLDSFKKYQNL